MLPILLFPPKEQSAKTCSEYIAAAVDLNHLAPQAVADREPRLRRYLVNIRIEEVILQLDFLDEHARVENIRLIDIDVHGVVRRQSLRLDILLNRRHLIVHEELLSRHISREAAHAVIHRDNIRIELANEVVERLQRRDLAARRHVDVDAKRRDARLGMELGVCMHGHMTLVEVRDDLVIHQRLLVPRCILFRNKEGHARALRIVILLRDAQDMCADHLRHAHEDLRQSL